MTTESALKNWRFGQAQAERLASAILHIEGFEDIDPQHPLGGPDDTKDLLCRRKGESWLAAVYFPTTEPTFAALQKKFKADFNGVAKHQTSGFAFFCNRYLSIGERQKLLTHTGSTQTEIYHCERIRSLLDAPKGCGVRLEYLRIPMTEAEQWAFWSTMNQDVVRRLLDHEKRRERQFESIESKIDLLLDRTNAIGFSLAEQRSSLMTSSPVDDLELPTSQVSLSTLCWLHRVLTEGTGLPEATRGRLRSIQVWIGPAGSKPENASFTPVPSVEVPGRMHSLLNWWREQHSRLRHDSRENILKALAQLHHGVLRIHPFLDANGRVARVLLDQAALELLGMGVSQELTADPKAYYSALRAADSGNLEPLVARLEASLQ